MIRYYTQEEKTVFNFLNSALQDSFKMGDRDCVRRYQIALRNIFSESELQDLYNLYHLYNK